MSGTEQNTQIKTWAELCKAIAGTDDHAVLARGSLFHRFRIEAKPVLGTNQKLRDAIGTPPNYTSHESVIKTVRDGLTPEIMDRLTPELATSLARSFETFDTMRVDELVRERLGLDRARAQTQTLSRLICSAVVAGGVLGGAWMLSNSLEQGPTPESPVVTDVSPSPR